jgi:hypothetical protein
MSFMCVAKEPVSTISGLLVACYSGWQLSSTISMHTLDDHSLLELSQQMWLERQNVCRYLGTLKQTFLKNTRQMLLIRIYWSARFVTFSITRNSIAGGTAFYFCYKFSAADCVILPDVSERLRSASSPIKRNHGPTDGANRLAKKCSHSNKLCDTATYTLKYSSTTKQ